MKNKFEGKTIILAITTDMDIYKCFVKNLEFLGFNVVLVCNKDKFKYKNIFIRILNFLKKTIFNDKVFKRNLIRKYYSQIHIKQLNKIKSVDYSLFIRADLFDKSVIEKVISLSKKNYAYQWDGMERFPEIKNLVTYFDAFYVFDKLDLNCKNFPTTNFYFDCFENDFKSIIPKFDVFYIGSYDGRIKKLIEICEFLHNNGLKLKIVLLSRPKKKLAKYPYITFIKKPISYFENLVMINNCKIVIDMHHENLHSGLSFRPFEALGYDKKIITSNTDIKKYDFYSSKNIFVAENNLEGFKNFLIQEHEVINSNIKNKYGFSNWINYILQEKEFQDINIP
jgi:hypothetical protein